jgi:hypothetical protein
MRNQCPSYMDAGVPTDNGLEPDNRDECVKRHMTIVESMAATLAKLNVPPAYMRAYKTSIAEYLVQEGFTAADIVENIDDAIDLTLHQPTIDHFIEFVDFGRFP